MKIQSLSIVVPGKRCINDCLSCVSKMRDDSGLYKNQLEDNLAFYDLYLNDYLKRLEFCRDNGCNTIVLTGNIEPQQNKRFLADLGIMMRIMERPFRNVEMQTTGVLIDEAMFRFLRNHVGVNTISLSLFSLDNTENQKCRNSRFEVDIEAFCILVKKYDFNLRLCLNLTKYFSIRDFDLLFEESKKLGANQVTLRRLFSSNDDSPQSKWVMENSIDANRYQELHKYVEKFSILRYIEYGFPAHSIKGLSVVIDGDCMAKDIQDNDVFKYLILRPNGKLYGSWDDPASLIF